MKWSSEALSRASILPDGAKRRSGIHFSSFSDLR